ncbi:cyclic nucleotide-binding domain-containing protein [Desulfosporosinus sp. Sb-LF]|uniref:cyclic nucleotide-binding domain-containing protein n=1 Tax=Desulfosporosinus sp. Sb-LF TaxID=2560027 RepID=UPI00107F6842|nr:cyclic nucleotide-binding domain-containing protein [Desulfosporosinus sp. Sb-LF]TGE32052.1 cyclic nucleotide-binding domain-containing protein [Desulfosporosinus sp. Sb-LF]
MNDDKVYSLSNVEFLADLTAAELTELASDFEWEKYDKGSEIIRQGQEQHFFYILIKGKADVTVAKEGRSWLLNSLGPGATFGEFSLLTSKSAKKTIVCQEECWVLALEAESFARMLLRWPKLYLTFIGKLTGELNEANLILSEAKYKEILRSTLQLTQYKDKFYGLWGGLRTTKEVERKLEELAHPEGHLLLTGERGTGRQMMAWYVHQRQSGKSAPFVVVEGQRFDQQWRDLIKESVDTKDSSVLYNSNLFDIAEGGTLFIREINLISPHTQHKLAQALNLQKNKCFVIGSLPAEPDDLGRIIIPELRECFAHTYEITPLRERKRDIPILAQGFLEKLAQKNHRNVPTLNKEATQLLLSHHYQQGNVSELIQVIERAFYIADQDVIGLEQIFFGPTSEKSGHTINLLAWPKVEKVLKNGAFIAWTRRVTIVGFSALVLLLLLSPEIAVRTKIFTLVWGLWWPALAIISPFLGRLWCTVCPFSSIMDFVQKRFHKNRPIPKFIMKYDFLIISFLFLLIFWIEVFTNMRSSPSYTVILLISIQVTAILVGITYPRHTWCRHFCPLGGFIGTASIGSMLEVRADATVCLNKCTTFDCYVGKGNVPGCPMSQHLPYLDNNLDCKLCFNCVRNCPNGSVQVNLRFAGREVWHLVRVNQGYAFFIGVMLAILIPLNYFEPLQGIWPSTVWKLWFSLFYWASALLGGTLAWLIAKPFKTKAASLRVKLIFALTPLVLAGHIMYQVAFIPGVHSLFLGIGYVTSSGLLSLNIPFTSMAKGIAAAFGLVLTGITVAIVLLRTKKKRATRLKLERA